MIITIPKDRAKEVADFRKEVARRQKEEEKRFTKLCKHLKIDPESAAGDTLFDYVYNGSAWNVEFE